MFVILSTQDNTKPLEQVKSGFKGTINWNKHQSKVTIERQNQYLDHLVNPSFQGVNIVFILLFENNAVRTGHQKYFLPKVGIMTTKLWLMEETFLINQ